MLHFVHVLQRPNEPWSKGIHRFVCSVSNLKSLLQRLISIRYKYTRLSCEESFEYEFDGSKSRCERCMDYVRDSMSGKGETTNREVWKKWTFLLNNFI